MRLISKASLRGAAAVAACVLSAGAAHGQVVWADDFTGESVGAAPTSDFMGGAAGNDYTLTVTGNGSYTVSSNGNAAPGLALNDPEATPAPTLTVFATQWAPVALTPTNNLLVAQFDFRVDDFNTGTANANPRFVLRHANAGNQQVVVAFGRTTTVHVNDGPTGGDHDLLLASAVPPTNTSLITPSDTTAIGLIPGVGWAPGFDFGNYDADTSLNDTHDQFYHVTLSYDFNTGALAGTATNVLTNESADFARTMTAGLTFTNAGSSILLSSTGSNLAQGYFDNLQVSVVPEPATPMVLLGGAGLLALRRRRGA